MSRYDGETFVTFTDEDGLAHNMITSVLEDREGHFWFGTFGGGVSRYDGKTWTTLTEKDGLTKASEIRHIYEDREGALWLTQLTTGSQAGGVTRYAGRTFTHFTPYDGLPHPSVYSIFQDQDHNFWFGTPKGVVRYDERTLMTFTRADGLPSSWVQFISQDRDGNLLFSTVRGGISRYDGKTFTNFAIPPEPIRGAQKKPVYRDRDNNFWFGTRNGVVRFDGQTFTNFTTQHGLADNEVLSIYQDRESNFWFGTREGGVTRYDGKSFTTFTRQHGLGSNQVRSTFQDREGHLWFGTFGGVCRAMMVRFLRLSRPRMAWQTIRCFPSCRTGMAISGSARAPG